MDANVVMTGEGGLVEVQATAERTPLSRTHLDELLALAQTGIEGLRAAQEAALAERCALLLATRNDHKLREFERLLPGVELEPLPDGARQPGGDRRHLRRERADQGPRRRRRRRGGAAFADDSGIEAEALDWRPGVRTARFAGETPPTARTSRSCTARPPPAAARGTCA